MCLQSQTGLLCLCHSLILCLCIKFSIFEGLYCCPLAYNALIFFLLSVPACRDKSHKCLTSPNLLLMPDLLPGRALEFSVAHRNPSLSLLPGDAVSEVWEAGLGQVLLFLGGHGACRQVCRARSVLCSVLDQQHLEAALEITCQTTFVSR